MVLAAKQDDVPRKRRGLHSATLLAAAITLVTACGTQISPEEHQAANSLRDSTAVGGDGLSAAQPSELSLGGVAPPADAVDPAPGLGTERSGETVPQDAALREASPGQPSESTAEAPEDAPAPPVPTGGSASCDGFRNQPGVTDEVIRIANVADISGPVPGLFQASKYAMDAFIAYFNSSADLCGRKLELLALDTGTSASGDQTSYATACESAFAAVGSMSAFDSGGAATAEKCGIPDLRSMVLNESRLACTTCFATQPLRVGQYPSALADFYMRTEPAATKNAAFIYLSAGAAADAARTQFTAMEKRGMRFVYTQSMDVAEFNYAPYVRAMIDRGVEWVQFLGSYENAIRLRQAMAEQKFDAVFILDGTAYQEAFVEAGGSNVEGSVIGINWPMFDEAAQHPELLNYLRWLEVVHPGAEPSMYGVFAWSAARLFVTTAAKLGGRLERSSMVSELKKVRDWTSEGLHAPTQVGSKSAPACWRFIRVEDGRWRPFGPPKYSCGPLIYP